MSDFPDITKHFANGRDPVFNAVLVDAPPRRLLAEKWLWGSGYALPNVKRPSLSQWDAPQAEKTMDAHLWLTHHFSIPCLMLSSLLRCLCTGSKSAKSRYDLVATDAGIICNA